jgi:hypothetical protein
MTVLPKKPPPPFPPDSTVFAITSFGYAGGTVHRGEKFRGDDPLVLGNPGWFADVNTPTAEVPNMWAEMEPPPAPVPSPGFNVQVQSVPIPPHRRVRSKVFRWFPTSWAPGSPGEKRGVPPPFGSALKVGQILDIGDPLVAANPQDFEFIAREVSVEDIQRARKEAT